MNARGRGFAASRGGRRYADDVGEFLVAVSGRQLAVRGGGYENEKV